MPETAAYIGRAAILAEELVKTLSGQGKTIAAAESCTGGLAADYIIRVPGASKVFWGSFVTYTVDSKIKMLGVPGELIKKHGVVSSPIALAMAEGALKNSGALTAFSVTGLAGPEGDNLNPIGTVWIGLAGKNKEGLLCSKTKHFLFQGSRNEVREAAAAAALEVLLENILTWNGY